MRMTYIFNLLYKNNICYKKMENILNDGMIENDNIKIYSFCYLTNPYKHTVLYSNKKCVERNDDMERRK